MKFDHDQACVTFDEFLMIMDDQIEWLLGEAVNHRIILDGTTESLDRLESLYDLMAVGKDEEDCSALRVVLGRYLGEHVRKHYGGQWTLPLDDPKSVNFNVPVIVGHSSCAWLEFNPIRTLLAYSLRQCAGSIRSIVDASVNPVMLDLKELSEE